jgi:hypothetical protein
LSRAVSGCNSKLFQLTAKLLKNGTLKAYKGFPHGMPTSEGETINADLLAVGWCLQVDADLVRAQTAQRSVRE